MEKMAFSLLLLLAVLITTKLITGQNTASPNELCQDLRHFFDCEKNFSEEVEPISERHISCELFCDQQNDCDNHRDEDPTICSNWTRRTGTNISAIDPQLDEACMDEMHDFHCAGGYSQEHPTKDEFFIPCAFYCNGIKTCPNGEDENKTICARWKEKLQLPTVDPMKVCPMGRIDYSYFHCRHGNSSDYNEWGLSHFSLEDHELPCEFFCDGHPDCFASIDENSEVCTIWKELKKNYYTQPATTKPPTTLQTTKPTSVQTTKSPVIIQIDPFKENLFATLTGNLIFAIVFTVIYLLIKWKKRKNQSYFEQKDNLDIELITGEMKKTNDEIV